MIAASGPILAGLGLRHENEIIGTMDDAFFPREIANGFRADDQQVICSGLPLVNRLVVWYDKQRVLDWFLTTKVPVMGRRVAPSASWASPAATKNECRAIPSERWLRLWAPCASTGAERWVLQSWPTPSVCQSGTFIARGVRRLALRRTTLYCG